MGLPEFIKIGPHRYSVAAVSLEALDGNWGHIGFQDTAITVFESLEGAQQALTTMHEIFHGVFKAGGDNDLDNNEELVGRVSASMLAALIDSPGLLEYFIEIRDAE